MQTIRIGVPPSVLLAAGLAGCVPPATAPVERPAAARPPPPVVPVDPSHIESRCDDRHLDRRDAGAAARWRPNCIPRSWTQLLAGNGPYTVFAPTDTAFTRLAPGIARDLLAPENRAALVALLRYHIVPGTMTTEQLTARIRAGGGRTMLTTLGGQPITATMTGDVITLTSVTGNRSYVEAADVAQANGIIHVVNGVLVPKLPQ